MSQFGLVHGGGFGAWCWTRLLPELEAEGHSAATVDLTPDEIAAGAAACKDTWDHAVSMGGEARRV